MTLSSYDNLQKHIRELNTPEIEVFKNEYADRDYEIEMNITEFTAICPKTGLPDYANFCVRYVPDKNCIELKSFKEYLMFYRDVGIFHEHVTNRIRDDFVKNVQPRRLWIKGCFNIRGGIQTNVISEYPPSTSSK
jgi:7-cyano-7-deazaguanine reductase